MKMCLSFRSVFSSSNFLSDYVLLESHTATSLSMRINKLVTIESLWFEWSGMVAYSSANGTVHHFEVSFNFTESAVGYAILNSILYKSCMIVYVMHQVAL